MWISNLQSRREKETPNKHWTQIKSNNVNLKSTFAVRLKSHKRDDLSWSVESLNKQGRHFLQVTITEQSKRSGKDDWQHQQRKCSRHLRQKQLHIFPYRFWPDKRTKQAKKIPETSRCRLMVRIQLFLSSFSRWLFCSVRRCDQYFIGKKSFFFYIIESSCLSYMERAHSKRKKLFQNFRISHLFFEQK